MLVLMFISMLSKYTHTYILIYIRNILIYTLYIYILIRLVYYRPATSCASAEHVSCKYQVFLSRFNFLRQSLTM